MIIKKLKSFTYIEVLIAMIIFVIGISAGTSWTLRNLSTNELQTTQKSLVGVLRTTHAKALANAGNSDYGVALQSSTYTIYIGSSLNTTPDENKQTFSISQDIQISTSLNNAATEITFAKQTGETNQYGTITLTNTGNTTATISISEIGLISWQ